MRAVEHLRDLAATALFSAGLMVQMAVLLLVPTSALATLVHIDQVIYQSGTGQTPSLMTGTLDITAGGVSGANYLTIVMTNTSANLAFTDATAPASMLLTGFGLQLPGVDILSGTVTVGAGEVAVNFDVGQSSTNISNQYMYANKVIAGYGMTGVLAVDSIVTSVNNGQGTRFTPGILPTTIGGPGYGAISANETQFGHSQPAVLDSITFVLRLNGNAPTVAAIDAGNVVLAFGSPNRVSEPGSLALFGAAAAGLGWMRRRKQG